jgi:hypothetical protein
VIKIIANTGTSMPLNFPCQSQYSIQLIYQLWVSIRHLQQNGRSHLENWAKLLVVMLEHQRGRWKIAGSQYAWLSDCIVSATNFKFQVNTYQFLLEIDIRERSTLRSHIWRRLILAPFTELVRNFSSSFRFLFEAAATFFSRCPRRLHGMI